MYETWALQPCSGQELSEGETPREVLQREPGKDRALVMAKGEHRKIGSVFEVWFRIFLSLWFPEDAEGSE